VIDIFQDVNDKLDTWTLIFNSIINQHAPIVEKRVKWKKLPPWMNSSIIDCIRIRDKFKKRAKTNILANTMCKKLKNQVVKMIANAKSVHMRNEIIENMGNPKKLWKTRKRAVPTHPIPSSPSFIETHGTEITDPLSMANAFNDHFTNIQLAANSAQDTVDEQVHDDIHASISNFINARIDVSTQFDIPLMTTQQVEEYIKRIGGNKATGLDGIGIKILKLALPVISQSLTHIYNASITKAVFPDKFKKAKLTLVYKKDSPHDRNNYRSISVLPVISKPLERHVASSYLKYLCKNNLLYSKQSAYRPNHSCETALLNLTDNWLKAMDKGKFVGSVFLDLSKAFDLVSHDILLSKIAKYHASEPTLRWFKSYLYD